MSLKYSTTTADYMQWNEAMNLIRKLAKDNNYKMWRNGQKLGYF